VDLVRKRTPRTEALTITDPIDGETYASAMKRAMDKVSLTDIDVQVTNV
jgi:hypothetical protein